MVIKVIYFRNELKINSKLKLHIFCMCILYEKTIFFFRKTNFLMYSNNKKKLEESLHLAPSAINI